MADTPTPWADILQADPPGQIPPRAETPLGRSPTPWVDTPQDTVNEWAVRILLECILV